MKPCWVCISFMQEKISWKKFSLLKEGFAIPRSGGGIWSCISIITIHGSSPYQRMSCQYGVVQHGTHHGEGLVKGSYILFVQTLVYMNNFKSSQEAQTSLTWWFYVFKGHCLLDIVYIWGILRLLMDCEIVGPSSAEMFHIGGGRAFGVKDTEL